MNRLVLLGNGFDRAHQMQTDYNHFIESYIRGCFRKASKNENTDNALFTLYKCDNRDDFNIETATLNDFQKFVVNHLKPDERFLNESRNRYVWYIKTPFLISTLDSCHKHRWVDIENQYYDSLLHILNADESQLEEDKPAELRKLNEAMACIGSEFEEYLTKHTNNFHTPEYYSLFEQPFELEDIILPTNKLLHEYFDAENIRKKLFLPADIRILNFNYTDTVARYTTGPTRDREIRSINIHGQLKNKRNPIIFGFGDELDPSYVSLEKARLKGYLKYVKSMHYLYNSNYKDLIRYIEAAPFQVYVVGHSCGLSDRTMLNMIFEHENCLSIKIFYHNSQDGSNDHADKVEEISRHFKDKSALRRKVVEFERCSPMPQAYH